MGQDVKFAARRAANSKWLDRLARLGLCARGLIYVLVGWLALQVAFGNTGKQADRGGAVHAIASKPFGTALLWLIGVGFAGLALWRLSEAAFGPSGTADDTGERLKSLARAVLYTALSITTISYVLGASSSAAQNGNSQSVTATAKVMRHTGGRWLVAIVGLIVLAIGCFLAYEGAKQKFKKYLKLSEMSASASRVVERLGMYGGIARGLVIALAGVFLVIAAVRYDPGNAKGLDATLRAFADTPLGPWLLVLVAVGLVAFGIYSWCEARWRKV